MVRTAILLLVVLIQDDGKAEVIRKALADLSNRDDRIVDTALSTLEKQGIAAVVPILNHMTRVDTPEMHVLGLGTIVRKMAKRGDLVVPLDTLGKVLTLLKTNRSLKIRLDLAAILGSIDPAGSDLKEVLMKEEKLSVEFDFRAACVTSLGKIGVREEGAAARKTTEFLVEVFEKDVDMSVRRAALSAIQKVGSKAILALPSVVKFARDEVNHFDARLDALAMVGALKELAVGEGTWLKLMAERGEPVEIRIPAAAVAASVTGRTGDYLRYLVEGVGLRKYEVRIYSLRALGELRSKAVGAVDAVRPLLEDLVGTIRFEAATTLGMIGPAASTALTQLERLLKDPDPAIVEAAETAIRSIAKQK